MAKNYTKEQITAAMDQAEAIFGKQGCPVELLEACKIDRVATGDLREGEQPLHPLYPLRSNMQAVKYCAAWDILEKGKARHIAEYSYDLTHSHAGEFVDLEKHGVDKVYEVSEFTKYVSLSWVLAGRYEYDLELIKWLAVNGAGGLVPWRLIDFGAAPWIQATFYAKLGLDVTAVNKSIESDCHRFGRFFAMANGFEVGPNPGQIHEYESTDPAWRANKYDIAYTMDVLEHIPPTADGKEGWVEYADALYECLNPGGFFYGNAPFGEHKKGEVAHPVESHPVHYTSETTFQAWAEMKGLKNDGKYFTWTKPLPPVAEMVSGNVKKAKVQGLKNGK